MTNTKAISYNIRERVFWALLTLAIVCGSTYVYAIASTIQNVAERQQLEKQLAVLTTKQSELEFAYIAKRSQVNLGLALNNGFQEVPRLTYISRVENGALSLNTQGNQ